MLKYITATYLAPRPATTANHSEHEGWPQPTKSPRSTKAQNHHQFMPPQPTPSGKSLRVARIEKISETGAGKGYKLPETTHPTFASFKNFFLAAPGPVPLHAKNHPFGWFLNNPAPCYFPLTSIIAAAGLNFGVRDGNQCIPRAKSTGAGNQLRLLRAAWR